MRDRPLRPTIAVVCMSVLLWQAVVSAGALDLCRCALAGRDCCGTSASTETPPVCCCTRPPEKAEPKRACCGADRPALTSCHCSAQPDGTPVLDRPRPRAEPLLLPTCAWVDGLPAAAVDCRVPRSESPAVWPPGVRPQSLLCVWLI